MATAQEIAEWMLDELTRTGELYQETAVAHIALKFGYKFTYDNENGSLAIRRDVLAAFRRLTKDSVASLSDLGTRWKKFCYLQPS